MAKPGPIIGLIIGILMVVFPIIGMMTGEASLSDPKGKMIGFGFMIFGAFMVIVNIIVLVTGKENLLALSSPLTSAPVTRVSMQKAEVKKIRCRFCKKLYSAEYNGCPYCKKR